MTTGMDPRTRTPDLCREPAMDPTLAARIARFSDLKARMPASELPRWSLAQALEDAGQTEEAVTEYRQLVSLKPDYCLAWLRLGALLGATPEAREALDRAIALARAQGHEAPRVEAARLLAALEDDEA
jgi:tetratricopeptide (TPR) repeat protein